MDGFDNQKGIVVLAATNRPDSLDAALLRPGRFDRRVPVELPDLAGRKAILELHSKDVKTEPGIDLTAIARATPGASGADLANIINEGALRAVRLGRTRATQEDFEESVEVVIAGQQRKSTVLSDHEKQVVAYHEIGHAIVAARQKGSAPVTKITIVPRTSGALGYTMQVEEDERFLTTKQEVLDKLAVYCGGRAAEELIFGEMTTGAANDIEQATKLARNMITRFGMSDEFGMMRSVPCRTRTSTRIRRSPAPPAPRSASTRRFASLSSRRMTARCRSCARTNSSCTSSPITSTKRRPSRAMSS